MGWYCVFLGVFPSNPPPPPPPLAFGPCQWSVCCVSSCLTLDHSGLATLSSSGSMALLMSVATSTWSLLQDTHTCTHTST